jgi:PAS domain S-box-containing protein
VTKSWHAKKDVMFIRVLNQLAVDRLFACLTIILVFLLAVHQVFAQTTASISQHDLSKKNILILHSFSYEQAAYLTMDPIFVRRFSDAGLDLNNVHFEFLDIGKHPGTQYWKETAKSLKLKYEGHAVDVIILLHATGLDFLIQECKGLFSGVPVVHIIASTSFLREELRSDLERQLRSLKQPFIIMPFAVDAKATVETILRLQPDTLKLIVLGGGGPLEKRLEQTIRTELEPWQGRLDIEYIKGLPMDEVLMRVGMVPPKTAILFTTFYKDGTGKPYRPADAGRLISSAAKAPVFGLFETLVGDSGVVGGVMVNQGQEAERAASVAIEILKGKKITEPLTVVPTPLFPMFDRQQMDRWGFDEKKLPHGSIVINRPFSLWAQYWLYIIGGIVLVLLQAFFIVSMLVERNRKKRAEESLRSKNEELDKFFNVSLDLLCVANTEGYFVRLNPAFERIFGYTKQEFMTKPFLEFVHSDDRDATKKAMATLVSQDTLNDFSNRYRRKDGTYRWLEWRAAPSGNLIYAAARDVTDRICSTEELVERLAFEELLAEVSGRFVNVASEQVDSEINEAMQRICVHLGFDLAALWQWTSGSTSFFTMTHLYRPLPGPPPPERIEAQDLFPWCLQQLAAGKVIAVSTDDLPAEASRDQETWSYYGIKSALTFPLSAGGKAFVGALSFNTIKEKRLWPEMLVRRLQLVAEIFANALTRKYSDQALRESEERLDLAASSADVGLWVVHTPGGLIWASDKARALHGFKPEEGLDIERILAVCHPDDRERIRLSMEMSFESGEYSGNEYRILLPDGSMRWLATRGRSYFGLSGIPERFMGVVMDITERKLAQTEARRIRMELLHVERMSRLGELVASLAHELNQPLAAILSSTQAALRFLQSTSPDLNLIRTILQNVVQDDKRAAGVITSLRSLVKKEEREKETLSIHEVLREVLNLFRSEAIIQNVEIKTDFESLLPPVYGDRIQLQQVVLNLITNAIEATAEIQQGQRTVILRTQTTEHGIQVAVRDFGPGIDPAELDDIWEPYFTTKKAGLGMGLSVSRSIIRAHGGRIWAENNPDGGTTFVFEISAIGNQQPLERNL